MISSARQCRRRLKPSILGRKHIDNNVLKTAGSIFAKLVEVGASTYAKDVSSGSGGHVCFLDSTITVLSSIAVHSYPAVAPHRPREFPPHNAAFGFFFCGCRRGIKYVSSGRAFLSFFRGPFAFAFRLIFRPLIPLHNHRLPGDGV